MIGIGGSFGVVLVSLNGWLMLLLVGRFRRLLAGYGF